jgi:hypothetical protein
MTRVDLEGTKIGLETSSILSLIEVAPGTLPLQNKIVNAASNGHVFVTDKESIEEALQQINKSYENAGAAIRKGKNRILERENITKEQLKVIFIKALAENKWGREAVLRWGDCLLQMDKDAEDFWKSLEKAIDDKHGKYLKILKAGSDEISIDSSGILPYWVSPNHKEDLLIKIKVINNKTSFQEFSEKLLYVLGGSWVKSKRDIVVEHNHNETKIKHNDIMDFYHVVSLFDVGVREIWTCDEDFIKCTKKLLESRPNRFHDIAEKVKIEVAKTPRKRDGSLNLSGS